MHLEYEVHNRQQGSCGNMNPSTTGRHFANEPFDIFSLNCEYFATSVTSRAHACILETLLNNEILLSLYIYDVIVDLRHF